MRLKLAIGVPLVSVLIALAMTAWNQHQALSANREHLADARATNKGQATVIKLMKDHANQIAQDGAELTATLQRVQDLTSESRQIWETLKRENKEFKTWAESALPADVIRLRSRPTITGAAAYQSWLQQSHSLHAAGEPATE